MTAISLNPPPIQMHARLSMHVFLIGRREEASGGGLYFKNRDTPYTLDGWLIPPKSASSANDCVMCMASMK